MRTRPSCTVLAALTCLSLTACCAREPGPVETRSIQWTKHHLTVRGKGQSNPIQATAENIDIGENRLRVLLRGMPRT